MRAERGTYESSNPDEGSEVRRLLLQRGRDLARLEHRLGQGPGDVQVDLLAAALQGVGHQRAEAEGEVAGVCLAQADPRATVLHLAVPDQPDALNLDHELPPVGSGADRLVDVLDATL